MSAPLDSNDRRQVATVAIIGNDAVLEAAPATPVQLAHACLHRGFTVAVPASWGDELVASETVRRLASRARGPAVMCVCPFVRSRLLAPGPDLAPFLVSLVAPPVAVARYLRAAYGEHGVHITYIGGCPSAEDPSIDEHLTPDAFFADLAEHGIALAEQPLVFDSIVPPDRRRWCSLPGGTPTAETLWSDSDTRTLVEIDRGGTSTDLAQHLITNEHVLLDLAPGLGCVCSGAIHSSPSRTARAAVTDLEPPRAPRPVIDPAPMVSLDAPVAERVSSLVAVAPSAASAAEQPASESRLDELLGGPIDQPWTESESGVEVALAVDFTVEAAILGGITGDPTDRATAATASTPQAPAGSAATLVELTEAVSEHDTLRPTAPDLETSPPTTSTLESVAEPVAPQSVAQPIAPAPTERFHVRRRARPPMPVRYPTSSIPRATASDGKALPRAYVAKRRTPPPVTPPINEVVEIEEPETSRRDGQNGHAPPTVPTSAPAAVADIETVAPPSTGTEPSLAGTPSASITEQALVSATASEAETSEPSTSEAGTATPGTPASDVPGGESGEDQSARPNSNPAGAATESDTSAGPLVALLVALLAIGFFVLRALK